MIIELCISQRILLTHLNRFLDQSLGSENCTMYMLRLIGSNNWIQLIDLIILIVYQGLWELWSHTHIVQIPIFWILLQWLRLISPCTWAHLTNVKLSFLGTLFYFPSLILGGSKRHIDSKDTSKTSRYVILPFDFTISAEPQLLLILVRILMFIEIQPV